MLFDWPLRLFLIHCGKRDPRALRCACGVFAGWTGIAVNVFLALVKLAVAFFSGSVAVAADAVNNLADAGSCAVTVAGFKLAGKPADDEHPFGHGRMEYIAGLIVSVIIIAAGLNFLKESAVRVFNPAPVTLNVRAAVLLLFAVFCKFWLFGFFRAVGRRADAAAVKASAVDSLSDAGITSMVLVATAAGRLTTFPVDGVAGCVVALVVVVSGVGILREIADPLIGTRPEKEIVDELVARLMKCPGICGVHDCIIHSYGPNLYFATAHAEVDNKGDLVSTHDILERAEAEIAGRMPVRLTLHCDPFHADDPSTLFWRGKLETIVSAMDKRFKVYDFRIEFPDSRTPLLRFNLLIGRNDMVRQKEIAAALEAELKKSLAGVRLEITFVNAFV